MTIQFPEDPLTHIKTWQTKFKEHEQQRSIAEMETPGATKDSREASHNTSNATDSIKDWRTYWKDVLDEPGTRVCSKVKQKIIDEFLDTICCALEEMSGKEVFDCFVEAVQKEYEYTKNEYDKSRGLITQIFGRD